MASDSENATLQIETPLVCKPKRRSSIFRPTATENTLRCGDEIFPPNYRNELLEENIKWKEAYNNIKSEYLELKKKTRNTVQQSQPVISPIYENYVRKAEAFCFQVDNTVELHENAINYLNIRRQALEKEVQETSNTIREKLNM